MLKGINHSVIEVNDTGNEYYERALLIVRPVYASAQRSMLEKEARRMLRELQAPAVFQRRGRWKALLQGGVCAALGLTAGWLLRELF